MAHVDEFCTWFRAISNRARPSSSYRWTQPRLSRHSSSLSLANPNELRVPLHPALNGLRHPRPCPSQRAAVGQVAAFSSCPAVAASDASDTSADSFPSPLPATKLYAPDTLRADSRPPLDELRRPLLAAYSYTIGFQNVEDRVTELVEHFTQGGYERPLLGQPAAERGQLLARRTIALQALLKGAASSPGGVRKTFTPSQLVSIHEVFCNSDISPAGAASTYSFLSAEDRRNMLDQLCLLKAHFVFPILSNILDQLLADPHFTDFPTRQEATNILNYLLHPPTRKRGGQQKAFDLVKILSSRPDFEQTVSEPRRDARTWLGADNKPWRYWDLSSRMLAVKLSLQTVQFPAALAQCRQILETFSVHACNPDIPAYFILETVKLALEHSAVLEGRERAESFEFVEKLLADACASIVQAASRQRGSPPDGKPLDEFCRRAVDEGRWLQCATVLLYYKERSRNLTRLVSPHVLISLVDLLSRRDYDGTGSALARSLLGLAPDQGLSKEKWLLSLPFPFMRRIIKILCRLRLRPQVASLWKYWVSSGGSEAPLLVADAGCMQSIVRVFSPPPSPSLPKDDSARRRKTQELSDNKAFAAEVLETFLAAKSLKACSRIELTSLASAFFHLGRERQGFAAFTEILHRREVPDQYDVLVLLWALARHDLPLAVQIFISRSKVFSGKEDSSVIMRLVHATPAILDLLLVYCFKKHEYGLARLLVNGSFRNRQVYRHDENYRFFIITLQRIFEMGLQSTKLGLDKWEWFAKILAQRKCEHGWQPKMPVLACLIRAAAKGHTLEAQMQARSAAAAAKAEKKKPMSQRRGFKATSAAEQAELLTPKSSRRARSTEIAAAVEMLALAAEDPRSLLEDDLVTLVLGEIDSQARYISSEKRPESTRRIWVSRLDRIVSITRAMDARTNFRKAHAHAKRLPLWPELASDENLRDEVLQLSGDFYQEPRKGPTLESGSAANANGEGFRALEQEQATKLGADDTTHGEGTRAAVADEWEPSDLSDAHSASTTDRPSNNALSSTHRPDSPRQSDPPRLWDNVYLHESRFRALIQTYLTLGDTQGASEVFLWMRERDPRFTLGAALERRLKGLLGDLRMLYPEAEGEAEGQEQAEAKAEGETMVEGKGEKEGGAGPEPGRRTPRERPAVPLMSWTFDGRIIERTKPWWKVGL